MRESAGGAHASVDAVVQRLSWAAAGEARAEQPSVMAARRAGRRCGAGTECRWRSDALVESFVEPLKYIRLTVCWWQFLGIAFEIGSLR